LLKINKINIINNKEYDMVKSKKFSDLIVWQKAHQFVLSVYRLTKNFPKEETFGLTAQFRRAAISVPANIAEGFRKKGKLDKARFFNIAEGSLEECKYYLILTKDLAYTKVEKEFDLAEEVSKLLNAYSKKILSSKS
jgi:four helix bundle protein